MDPQVVHGVVQYKLSLLYLYKSPNFTYLIMFKFLGYILLLIIIIIINSIIFVQLVNMIMKEAFGSRKMPQVAFNIISYCVIQFVQYRAQD